MIHPTAIIESGAKLHPTVKVGAYSIIGSDVSIGEGTEVGPHVVITGHTEIGKFNKFYQFSSIGEASQDKKYQGEITRLIIGDQNIFRECVTVHRATIQGGGVTSIKDDNLFMANSHVAHDCIIGSHNILANSAALAGHVLLGDYIIMSGMCGVHQFCRIGSHAFISTASIVLKDVPPFVMVTGGPDPTVCGLNVTGLKRRGFSAETIKKLQLAYKVIYRQCLRVEEAIQALEKMQKNCPEIALLIESLRTSERGIIR